MSSNSGETYILSDRDIPVPMAVAGGFHREGVPMLGQAQRVLGLPCDP